MNAQDFYYKVIDLKSGKEHVHCVRVWDLPRFVEAEVARREAEEQVIHSASCDDYLKQQRKEKTA